MRVLITGGTGFVGSHLLRSYLSLGYKVYSTIRWRSRLDNVQDIKNQVTWIPCDITDSNCTNNIISSIRPHIIHHLAAISYVKYSFSMPSDVLYNNIIGTINILEAVKNYSRKSVLHLAGSSEEYGLVGKDDIPITENQRVRPCSPYGVSKLSQTELGVIYAKSYNLMIAISRAFNHSGKYRNKNFIIPKIVLQGLEIKYHKRKRFELGNISSIRDFTHVKDMCNAYILLARLVRKNPYLSGEIFNICSNKGYSIKDIVDKVSKKLGIEAKIKINKENKRPFDVPILIGSYKKFSKYTNWSPKYTLDDIIDDIIEEMR